MLEGRDFGAASTIGGRDQQEDDWGTHVDPPPREERVRLLAAVADGMGGMPAGGRASRLAIGAFLDSYAAIRRPPRERLRHALAHANREVGIAVEAEPALDGMGCTLVAALFLDDRCEWLSVGDSLLLRYRRGSIRRVNPLHIYAKSLAEQVRRGEITPEAAAGHPDRAALTSAVQGTVLEEVAQGEFPLNPGDVVMLATDGITTLSEDELTSTCARHTAKGAAEIAEALIDRIEATARDGQDNATVVAVRHCPETDRDPEAPSARGLSGPAGASPGEAEAAGASGDG